jgi:hypothetical protein
MLGPIDRSSLHLRTTEVVRSQSVKERRNIHTEDKKTKTSHKLHEAGKSW